MNDHYYSILSIVTYKQISTILEQGSTFLPVWLLAFSSNIRTPEPRSQRRFKCKIANLLYIALLSCLLGFGGWYLAVWCWPIISISAALYSYMIYVIKQHQGSQRGTTYSRQPAAVTATSVLQSKKKKK